MGIDGQERVGRGMGQAGDSLQVQQRAGVQGIQPATVANKRMMELAGPAGIAVQGKELEDFLEWMHKEFPDDLHR